MSMTPSNILNNLNQVANDIMVLYIPEVLMTIIKLKSENVNKKESSRSGMNNVKDQTYDHISQLSLLRYFIKRVKVKVVS